MALAAVTVWEVRTAGSDTSCSGGYVTGAAGTDYSQQNAAQYTNTDLVIDGTTNTLVSSALHNFVTADVGNLLRITAGSGFTTGFFQIVSVAANKATLDRSAGTLSSTGGTYFVGGALATPGLAVANYVAGNTIYCKGGYTTTTDSANVAGGRLSFGVIGGQTTISRMIGYGTTRGDATKYTITHGATFTTQLLNLTNGGSNFTEVSNIAIVGNSTVNALAIFNAGRSNRIVNFKVSGYSGSSGGVYAVDVAIDAVIENFEVSGGTFAAAVRVTSAGQIRDGWVHGVTGHGVFVAGSNACVVYRVASCDNTAAGFNNEASQDNTFIECAAWNNGGSDYTLGSSTGAAFTCIRCISGGSTGYNFDNRSGPDAVSLYYCAGKTNTTALYPVAPNINVGFVTLTGEPFTNRGGGDFSINNVAGQGAALRGIAETLFGLTTTYADIGAAQVIPAAPSGGSGPNIIVNSGAASRASSW